jgi:hypothetical protein
MRVNGVRPGQADQLAVLLAIAAALLDELHQSFVPLRSANWWDLTKDFIGIWLARELVVYIRSGKSCNGYTADHSVPNRPSPGESIHYQTVFIDAVNTGGTHLTIPIGAVPPDGCLDTGIAIDHRKHIIDPGRLVSSHRIGSEFRYHKGMIEYPGIETIQLIINMGKTAPFFSRIISAGIVTGQADHIYILIARVIKQGMVPFKIRERVVVGVPDPDNIVGFSASKISYT